MKRLAAVLALAAAPAFAQSFTPGQRVQVDIAGYKYLGTFRGVVECPRRGEGQCLRIDRDHGGSSDVLPRYVKPAPREAEAAQAKTMATAPSGKHTCTFFSGTLQNIPGFTLEGGGRFTDHKGRGSWTFKDGVIAFKGGAWDGQKARVMPDGSIRVLRDNGSPGAVTCSRSKG